MVPVGLLLIIAVLVHYASPGYQNAPPRRSRGETTAAGGSKASDVADDAERKSALPSEDTNSAGATQRNLVDDDGSKTTDQPDESQAARSARDNPSENGPSAKLNGSPAAPTGTNRLPGRSSMEKVE